MRILLVTQYFSPEVTSCALRMDAFASAWSEMGHDVTVLTAVPNHPEGVILPAYRRRLVVDEERSSARLKRVWVRPSPRKSALSRLATYGSFAAMASVVGALRLPRPDVVVATTPPPFAGVAGALLARRYRAPFVLDVRDLWPDAALATGEMRAGRAASALTALVQWLYRRADLVVAATDGFAKEIGHGAQVVPNGCDPRVAATPDAAGRVQRTRLGLDDRFVLGFVGNHGVCEGLEGVIDALAGLRDVPDVHLLMVGDGPRRQDLISHAEAVSAGNVTFHPSVAVERVGAFLRAADILVIPLQNDPHFATRFPAKMFDAWSCSRPVLIGWDGDARRLAEDVGGGSYAPCGQPREFAAEIRRLRGLGPRVLADMGAAGREWVLSERDRAGAARGLGRKLERLAGVPSAGEATAPLAGSRSAP